MRILLLLLLLSLASIGNAEQKVINLPTAADGQVEVIIDGNTKLPIGASDKRAKIIEASLAFLPRDAGDPMLLTWRYAIQFDPSVQVRSVTIEDERDAVLRPLIKDESPILRNGVWRGQEAPMQLTEELFNSMNSNELWILLRRVVVVYSDGEGSKLHQLVLEPPRLRHKLLDEVMAILKHNKK